MSPLSKYSVLALFLGVLTLQGCEPTEEPTEEGTTAAPDATEPTPSPIREAGASCPYNFEKPKCVNAEPQAPRDLSSSGEGEMKPKAVCLTLEQTKQLPLVNVHFHLGAEHKSDEYADATDSTTFDGGRRLDVPRRYGLGPGQEVRRLLVGEGRSLAEGKAVRPGFMCATDALSEDEKAEYTFQYCKGVEVGKTYEVHYVHSSAGYSGDDTAMSDADLISDGLGGAANGRGLLNPMITVEGQVFLIVNGDDAPTGTLMDGVGAPFVTAQEFSAAVMYPGSTTGPSHDNEVCSPYAISWHVDKRCNKISAESFDDMCKVMKEKYKMTADLAPHGSRKILDKKFVVLDDFVKPLA